MASVKSVFYLGVCVCAWIITAAAGQDIVAKNVRWMSLDFKTTLTWTAPANHTFTVLYSVNDGNWMEVGDCIQVSDNHCDLTKNLEGNDGTYTADIQTDEPDSDYTVEEPPHTFSSPFNPYKESNISAPHFSLEIVDENTVSLNITDPLTGIHHHSGRQLNIRDVLDKDLKYKISYYKSESTGKRDVTADSSVEVISKLDAGQIYCFMVAAYIPKRPKISQQGPWSEPQCIKGSDGKEPSLGAWVGGVFVCLTVLVIIVTVTVLCCRCCRQRNKSLHTSQSSVPV